MTQSPVPTAQAVCEEVLGSIRQYDVEHSIWPSEVRAIDRMLSRRLELVEVYEELHVSLNGDRVTLHRFFDAVLGVAAVWNPEKLGAMRAARNELEAVNSRIADLAEELASLLEQRCELKNRSSFADGTHYHVCELLVAAGGAYGPFASHVREPLKTLRRSFGLEYWPSLPSIILELANDARAARVEPTDPVTAAGVENRRSSLADFVKAMRAAVDDYRVRQLGPIPDAFRLSDNSTASLVNCLLDFGPDELIDAAYIKRLRQRERERAPAR